MVGGKAAPKDGGKKAEGGKAEGGKPKEAKGGKKGGITVFPVLLIKTCLLFREVIWSET